MCVVWCIECVRVVVCVECVRSNLGSVSSSSLLLLYLLHCRRSVCGGWILQLVCLLHELTDQEAQVVKKKEERRKKKEVLC